MPPLLQEGQKQKQNQNQKPASNNRKASYSSRKSHQSESDSTPKWKRGVESIYSQFKLLSGPLLSILILSALALIKPTSDAIGKFAYLMFPFLHLFFFPSPNTLGTHIETVILNIIGGSLGLGYSFLATSSSVWIDGTSSTSVYDESRSRALAACMLVLLTFLGGWLSSAVPRLRSAVRITLFNATWAIGIGAQEITYETIRPLLHPTLVTAGVSLFANLVCWPKTSGREFTDLISKGFDITCELLDQTVDDFFPEEKLSKDQSSNTTNQNRQENSRMRSKNILAIPSEELISLRSELLEVTSHLRGSLESSEYEITFGRIPVSQHKAHVTILGHIRSWAACGMGLSVGSRASIVARAAGVEAHEREKREIEKDVVLHPELIDEEKLEAEKTEDHANQQKGTGIDSQEAAESEEISISMFESSIRSLTREVIYSLQLVKTCMELTQAKSSNSVHHRRFYSRTNENSSNKGIRTTLLAAAMAGGVDIHEDSSAPDRAVLRQRRKLASAVESFQVQLLKAQDGIKGKIENDRKLSGETETGKDGKVKEDGGSKEKKLDANEPVGSHDPSVFFRNDFYAVSFFMVSLMEVATESSAALRASQSKLRFWHAHPRARIWWPVWSWNAAAGSGALNNLIGQVRNDRVGMAEDDHVKEEKERNRREGLQEEELREREKELMRWNSRASAGSQESVLDAEVSAATSMPEPKLSRTTTDFDNSPTKISQFSKEMIRRIEHWSRKPSVLRARLFLSHTILSIKHSRHLRYAFKLALGVALLSLPAWLPGSPRSWWEGERGQWVVISFIYVLEFSSGATVRVSTWRILGTIAGGVAGLCIWYMSGSGNPYALGFLLTLFELPVAYLILFTEAPGVGIVSGVTYALIPLIPYLGGEYKSVANLAWIRGYQITLGILAALILNLTLFPYHARVELIRHVSRGTSQLQELYLSLSRQLLQAGHITSSETRADFELIEHALQTRLAWSRSLLTLMDLEVSLVPKPTKLLAEIIERLQTIADLLSGLRRTRDRGLRAVRAEAITNVLASRTDMVSTILLCLYVIGQALSTRAPLPQFLPSPRLALEALTLALEEQLSRPNDLTPEGGSEKDVDNNGTAGEGPSTPIRGRTAVRPLSTWCPIELPSLGMTPEGSRPSTPGRTHHRNVSRTGTPTQQQNSRDQSPRPKRKHNALFYILSEHALLADIIGELEALLILTRALVGEASFIQTSYLPRGTANAGAGYGSSPHDLHAISMSLSHMQGLTLQRELAAHGLGSAGQTVQHNSNKELLPKVMVPASNQFTSNSIIKPIARSPLNPSTSLPVAPMTAATSSSKSRAETSMPPIVEQRPKATLEDTQQATASTSAVQSSPLQTKTQPQAFNTVSSGGSVGRGALKSLFERPE